MPTSLALAIAAIVALAGCSAAPTTPLPQAAAVLDYDAQVVTLPLDQFVMSDRDARMVEAANAVLLDRCMNQQGEENPAAELAWQEIPATHTRLFGPWNLDWVAEHGYDYPPDPRVSALSDEIESVSARWEEIFIGCQETVPLFALVTLHDDNNIALQGWFETYSEAANRSEWKDAVSEWTDCLSAEGYEVPQEEWVPVLPTEKEAEIRAAIVDVQCKEKVNMILRLSNLMAEEQNQFIEENRSALEELRSLRDEILVGARDLLSGAG